MGETITLSEVDQYTADTLPPIDQRATTSGPHTVDELLAMNPDLDLFVSDSVSATIASLRYNATQPRTVLHTLMLADRLSAGVIAGRMHVDPRTDVRPVLDRLVEAGVVGVEQNSPEALKRYSLAKFALGAAFSDKNS